ncbi:class I-like SAM-binding methyltransferase super [Ancistrocladus abbreviatus]
MDKAKLGKSCLLYGQIGINIPDHDQIDADLLNYDYIAPKESKRKYAAIPSTRPGAPFCSITVRDTIDNLPLGENGAFESFVEDEDCKITVCEYACLLVSRLLSYACLQINAPVQPAISMSKNTVQCVKMGQSTSVRLLQHAQISKYSLWMLNAARYIVGSVLQR